MEKVCRVCRIDWFVRWRHSDRHSRTNRLCGFCRDLPGDPLGREEGRSAAEGWRESQNIRSVSRCDTVWGGKR